MSIERNHQNLNNDLQGDLADKSTDQLMEILKNSLKQAANSLRKVDPKKFADKSDDDVIEIYLTDLERLSKLESN